MATATRRATKNRRVAAGARPARGKVVRRPKQAVRAKPKVMAKARAKAKTKVNAAPQAKATAAWHAPASDLLKHYADRGVFRGQVAETKPAGARGPVHYKVRWHRNRDFHLVLDRERRSVLVVELLPAIPARSPMYREFAAFVDSFQDGSRPAHRSVDPARVLLVPGSRNSSVSLQVRILDDDYAYAMERLLTMIHETYLNFIMGLYDQYRVDHLGADPDWGK